MKHSLAAPTMRSVPTGFDFGGALRPDYVLKCSYGNDSIALIQFMHERRLQGRIVVLYNDTSWATSWWPARVAKGESLAKSYGFVPCQTVSKGMERLVLERKCWPRRTMQFCTEELKIEPTMSWLAQHDPDGKAVMVCGVRREESAERRNWPEWVDSSPKNEGRADWSPLAFHGLAERDALIQRAGWEVLPHRSRECRCVNAGSQDIKRFSEQDVDDIEAIERKMPCYGDNRFMYSPRKKKGAPRGDPCRARVGKNRSEERCKIRARCGMR